LPPQGPVATMRRLERKVPSRPRARWLAAR